MRSWLVPLALLLVGTVVAAAAGWGLSAGLGAAIALGPDEKVRPTQASRRPAAEARTPSADGERPQAPSAPPTVSRSTYLDDIVRRNIFDHLNVGKGAASDEDEIELCLEGDCDQETGEKSDLPVTLLGTIVVDPADYSSAMMRDDNSKQVGGYRIGDRILDATITGITARMVLVQRADGKREYILLDVDEALDSSPTPGSSGAGEGEGDDQIMKESDTSYVIDRALFDSSIQDIDALSKMARATPHRDASGNVDGFRLSAVRRNNLLYNLGIRSGDVVHSVNGRPLTSVSDAMGAMQSLQRDASFSFEISRRNQKMTMNYRVQ